MNAENMEARYRELVHLYEDGFFEGAKNFDEQFFEKNGRFRVDDLYRLWKMFSFGKYTLKYYLIHRDLMPTFGRPSKYKSTEDLEALYRECLRQNTTWQDISGYRDPPEDVLY